MSVKNEQEPALSSRATRYSLLPSPPPAESFLTRYRYLCRRSASPAPAPPREPCCREPTSTAATEPTSGRASRTSSRAARRRSALTPSSRCGRMMSPASPSPVPARHERQTSGNHGCPVYRDRDAPLLRLGLQDAVQSTVDTGRLRLRRGAHNSDASDFEFYGPDLESSELKLAPGPTPGNAAQAPGARAQALMLARRFICETPRMLLHALHVIIR